MISSVSFRTSFAQACENLTRRYIVISVRRGNKDPICDKITLAFYSCPRYMSLVLTPVFNGRVDKK